MGAARVLLQRGLRLNADCAEMWREYVRLELGFVEALRRRWDVLGISLGDSSDRGRGQGREQESQGERIDRAEEEAMGDEARGAIMDGAIVRQAIDGAAKGEHNPATLAFAPCSTPHFAPSSFTSLFCVISAADDRAVSESADSHCRISGARVFS